MKKINCITHYGRSVNVEFPDNLDEDYIREIITDYFLENKGHFALTDIKVRDDEKGIVLESEYDDAIINAPKFERIRRITGYLVGTLDRFNDAKRAEEHNRVKHTMNSNKVNDNTKFREFVDKIREEKGFSKIDWDN